MRPSVRHASAICLVAVLAAGASGCGVDIAQSGPPTGTAAERSAPSQQSERERRAADLPSRDAGELAIAGERQGSLSSNAATAFARSQSHVRPRYSAVGATEGFARLCRGEVDVVDSARSISRDELALCNANGLEIRTPIQIASDALVLATRNESDVGGDCLTVADVRQIYRAGSPIDNWSQLGFDDLSLAATGPGADGNPFSFFASQVLGVPSAATLDDVRSDYRPHGSDAGIRRDIVGGDRVRRVPSLVEQEVRSARARLARRRQILIGMAVVAARERALRSIRAANRRRARRHEAVRDPAALERRNLRRVNVAKRRAADRARRRFDARFDALRAARTRELLARARRTGVVGFVRFSYYEAYEDQLRPVEIDAGPRRDAANAASDKRARAAGLTPPERPRAVDGDGNRIPNCIFPSQQTITTGEYPLSRRVLLYTSTHGLGRSEVREFLAYALRNAQRLATSSRLVPITDRLRSDQYRFVTGAAPAPSEQALPGERVPGGSTSTTPPTTATTSRSSGGASTTPARTPAAAPSGGVPGVSSGVSAGRPQEPR
ncbi:MAG: phosphate transport system substrate-binding protein [Solirubrobacteraceae bacterium]|nr:phosphate transport system substrate-binding protein [Solirubrobacteraceae bacterium]